MNENEKNYWENFYANFGVKEPSDFARFVVDYFTGKQIQSVLDAGCGNGRDSYFLAQRFPRVLGVDRSFEPKSIDTCQFEQGDFTTIAKNPFDLIYSRFTFHSITNEDHGVFLDSIQNPGTYLCIETRSAKGQEEKRYYGDGHFRNLTDVEYLKNILSQKGFNILYLKEDRDFAIYKDKNPICIRAIAIKK